MIGMPNNSFVICVDDENLDIKESIKKNDIYTVLLLSRNRNFDGKDHYVLYEKTDRPPYLVYENNRFIPFPFSPN